MKRKNMYKKVDALHKKKFKNMDGNVDSMFYLNGAKDFFWIT